jgi:glutamate synthase (NADPH) small chain
MGKLTGFKEFDRKNGVTLMQKDVSQLEDIYIPQSQEEIKTQAARCMDCGVPFCSYNCPLVILFLILMI